MSQAEKSDGRVFHCAGRDETSLKLGSGRRKAVSGLTAYETAGDRLGREFEDTLPEFFRQGRRAVCDG